MKKIKHRQKMRRRVMNHSTYKNRIDYNHVWKPTVGFDFSMIYWSVVKDYKGKNIGNFNTQL